VFYRSDIRTRRLQKFHTFEELYFLVSGVTSSAALQKAKKHVKQKEHSYKSMRGETVSWRLLSLWGFRKGPIRNLKTVLKFTSDLSKA